VVGLLSRYREADRFSQERITGNFLGKEMDRVRERVFPVIDPLRGSCWFSALMGDEMHDGFIHGTGGGRPFLPATA
jgi:hypothetical protein